MPKAMSGGDVAAAASLAGESRAFIAGESDDDALGGNHGRGIDLVAKSVADPEFLTRLGVEGLEFFGRGKDEFVMVGNLGYEGRGPRCDPIIGANAGLAAGFIVLPDFLACGFVESDEKLTFARPRPEDHEVLIEDGRRSVPCDMPELAEIVVPLLLAGEVVAIEACGAEADNHSFTIGNRRSGAISSGGVLRLFVVVLDGLFPEVLAVGPIKAPQGSLVSLGIEGLRQEDAITPYHRGG